MTYLYPHSNPSALRQPPLIVAPPAAGSALLHPNPTTGAVYVDLGSIDSQGPVTLTVHDSFGRRLLSRRIDRVTNHGDYRLALPTTGVLFLSLADRTGTLRTERVLVLQRP